MIPALVAGTLVRAETKVSKSHKDFIRVSVKVSSGNDPAYVTLMIFGQAEQEMISALPVGSSLAAPGELRTDIWTPASSAPRVNITLMVDSVLALKKSSKPRRDSSHRPDSPSKQQIPMTSHAGDSDDFFGDGIPF